MKTPSYASIIAAICIILAIILMAVPAHAGGDNILANGIITIPAGATAGTNDVSLANNAGVEWGEIAAFRLYNGCAGTSGYVNVTCTDFAKPITLIASDSTTNQTLHILQTNTFSVVGTNLFVKNAKIVFTLSGAYTNAASSIPWLIYAK